MARRRARIAGVVLGIVALLGAGLVVGAAATLRPALALEEPCGDNRCGGVEGGADPCDGRPCGEVPGNPGPCGDVPCGPSPNDQAPNQAAPPAAPTATTPPEASPVATTAPGGQIDGGTTSTTGEPGPSVVADAAPELKETGEEGPDGTAWAFLLAAVVLLGAGAVWVGARRRAHRATTS